VITPTLLLGIDVGTSSCKLSLLEPAGATVASSAVTYAPALPQPGWVEQDPGDWYRALCDGLAILVRHDHVDLEAVGGVAVTGQMRGLVLLDGAGRVVRPAILWNDLRDAEDVEEIAPAHRARIEHITRNSLNTMCTLPKLLWLLRCERRSWDRARMLVFPKDYVRHRLTGTLETDPSDASGTSFFDVRSGEWSQEILDLFGIDPSRVPVVRSSIEVVGAVTPRASAETGLPAGVPVVCGGSDAVVESFAIGLTDASRCKVRLGTSGAISTVVDDIDRTTAGYCWSYVTPGRWMLDTNTRSCGQAVTWLRDLCYGDRPPTASTLVEIDRDAGDVPAGAEGVTFHPYLLGEDAPYWDPALRASIHGLSIGHRRAHLARAVYEGTAFALRDAMGTFADLSGGFRRYLFVGGGVRAPVWLSIVADVLGIDGDVPAAVDASTGAAMLAGVGIGVFRDPAHAVQVCERIERHVEHDPARTARYAALFERYRLIKRTLDPLNSATSGQGEGR
jgi:xylulokinase